MIQYNLMQGGFRNVVEAGRITGFQVCVKSAYYRGVPLSMLEGIDVTVDGQHHDGAQVRYTIRGRTYTAAELANTADVHWPWLEPAIVTVPLPGGLAPGLHRVEVVVKIRISYMPFNPVPYRFADSLVLLPPVEGPAGRDRPLLSASLYGYNGDLQAGTMTLEQCLADLADMGADGVEFLPEAIVPDYPNPPRAWVVQWHEWMRKYRLQPVAVDGGADTKLYKHRLLDAGEIARMIAVDLRLAHTLGCKAYRGLGSSWPAALGVANNVSTRTVWSTGITPFEIYEQLLPIAEDLDVRMGEELHIPFIIKSDWLDQLIDYIDRKKTRHLGVVPDLSIFSRRPPRQYNFQDFVGRGVPGEVVDYILKAREDMVPESTASERVQAMGGGPQGRSLAALVYHLCYPSRERNEARQLADLVPYTVHIHAKCHEILDDLSDEYSIPYSELVPVLAQAGYSGFISSEYEGSRAPFAASNQIRRQHLMIRNLWRAAADHPARGTQGAAR